MTVEPIAVGSDPIEAPVGLWRVPRSTDPVYRVIGLLPGDDGPIESVIVRVSSPHEAFDAAFTYCERAGRAYVVRNDAGDLVENPTTRCVVASVGARGPAVRCDAISIGFDYDGIDNEPVPICTKHAQMFHAGLRLNDQ